MSLSTSINTVIVAEFENDELASFIGREGKSGDESF